MTPNADIIRQLIIDLGLAQADPKVEWPIYSSFLPDVPDSSICVYDTAGTLDGRIMRTGEQIEHPGIMIHVRAIDNDTGWRKAKTIAEALDAQRRVSVVISSEETYVVYNFSRTGAILPLGMEEIGSRRRFVFSINAITTIRGEE